MLCLSFEDRKKSIMLLCVCLTYECVCVFDMCVCVCPAGNQ